MTPEQWGKRLNEKMLCHRARTRVYAMTPGGIARYDAERKRIRLTRRKAAKREDFKTQ